MDDLSDLVGPELASLVNSSNNNNNNNSSTPSKTSGTAAAAGSSAGGGGGSASGGSGSQAAGGDMPSDISDLRSSDLLQCQGLIDIDRIFADFQNNEHTQQVRAESSSTAVN